MINKRGAWILQDATLACGLLVALVTAHAWTQTEVYCSVNSVRTEALSNATRVTITADGLIEGEFDPNEFRKQVGNHFEPKALRAFPFRLTNARTKLGSFVDVSAYPVSHLTFAIPRESREGVGLDVEVVLYRPGYMNSIWLGRSGYGLSSPQPPQLSIRRSTDGREIIIIATSDRYREPEAAREVTKGETSSLHVSTDANGRLTVQALNVELGRVLRAVSETNGIQVTIRGGANYRASMSITGATPEALMGAVAQAYGLSVRSVGGIYFVTEGLPTEVDSYWAAGTAYFPLQHLPATEALDLLPNFLLRYVRADEGKNALVATGPPQLLDKLEADLRAIDRPHPQIQVRAIVVEQVSEGGLELASEIIFATGHQEVQLSGETGRLSYEVVEASLDDLHTRLRALEERGRIRTHLCPSVTVRSGNLAEVFLGQRRFFAFQRSVYPGRGSNYRRGIQEVVLESTDVGSRIQVKPWTGDGKTITVPLQVEANTILTVSGEGLPLVATRRVEGTVRLGSGDTIVVGGLVLTTPSDTRRRGGGPHTPVAGDFARSRTRTVTTAEAVVLLSASATYESRAGELPPP
ncbi:MAG: type II secretion system protein GspD [Candidatus Zipacnadales bacterium]